MRTELPQRWQQPTIPWQEYSLDAYRLICAFLNSRQTCLSELHADLTECLFMHLVCQHNRVRVFEQVSGKDGDHALCGLDNSPGNELFHARDRSRRGRFAADTHAIYGGFGLQDFCVGDLRHESIGGLNDRLCAQVTHRVADIDRGRDGQCFNGMKRAEAIQVALVKRVGACRLNRNDTREAVDQAKSMRTQQAHAQRRGVAKIACWKHNPVRDIPRELLHQLESERLLPEDAERVKRIEQVNALVQAHALDIDHRAVKIACDLANLGVIGDSLA